MATNAFIEEIQAKKLAICNMCQAEIEIVGHTFLKCEKVSQLCRKMANRNNIKIKFYILQKILGDPEGNKEKELTLSMAWRTTYKGRLKSLH